MKIENDEIIREIYSKDASIFQIVPEGVATPATIEELKAIVKYAYHERKSITARGAGTGISGGCLGKGIVIDVSRYLNHIIDIDPNNEEATIEPGVVLDDLNRLADKYGLKVGPETSTSNRATIGGMAANNAAGARSLKYGKMVDHVLEVDLIIDEGSVITFKELTEDEWNQKLAKRGREGDIYRACEKIRIELKEEILNRFPAIDRRVSGYNLDELLKPPLNLSKLIVGSEGTLGIISRLKIKLVKKPQVTGLVIVHFHSILDLMKSVNHMLRWNPLALEMIDKNIIKLAQSVERYHPKFFWLKGDPEAIVIAEFEGNTLQDVKLKISTFEADLRHHGIGYAFSEVTQKEKMKDVWEVRKGGLGLLMSKRSYVNACAFLEDMTIPPPRLHEFMKRFLDYLAQFNKEAGIYGHVGSGCMHIRPYLNLKSQEDLDLIARMMETFSSIVIEFGGALSGEHGDGIIRSGYNEKMFGAALYKGFQDLKDAFDPFHLMNPGKIVGGLKFEELEDKLKLNPKTPTLKFDTFYDFEKEGGFELAVDMCNGNGRCRKKESLMCPSFQATLNEYDSTRARANALQAMIHESLTDKSLANPAIHDILDLCLSCKGCKTECPSQVDMAKMKGEFLYHYQKEKGVPLRSRLIANLALLNEWAMPSLHNWLIERPFIKNLLKKLGISPKRTLPKLSTDRFSEIFYRIKQPEGKKVVLFNDTYTQFNNPEIGVSAIKVLNKLGYEVIVPPFQCCGRPAFSKGMLEEGKKQASKVIDRLKPYLSYPIIILEPSCFSALIDEYKDLRLDLPPFEFHYFDNFIADCIHRGELPLSFLPFTHKALVHGHCHQKALIGTEGTMKAVSACKPLQAEEIPSGCCGMAGSFGYEEEHYDISMKIGELKLLPTVRSATTDTIIIANGFSCRSQIKDGAGKNALHLAQVIDMLMTKSKG